MVRAFLCMGSGCSGCFLYGLSGFLTQSKMQMQIKVIGDFKIARFKCVFVVVSP